jgi:hypothetical protein
MSSNERCDMSERPLLIITVPGLKSFSVSSLFLEMLSVAGGTDFL